MLLKVRLERRIAKVAQSKRRENLLHIAGNLKQEASANVSERTVCHKLHRIGYDNRRPVRKPLLLALNKNRRL
ncbi:hypothetical protein TNCV_1146721 [Trichonephila clavipes]|nr:hypothetical protein TNCV_1146721 [Trichonephila clavipes]